LPGGGEGRIEQAVRLESIDQTKKQNGTTRNRGVLTGEDMQDRTGNNQPEKRKKVNIGNGSGRLNRKATRRTLTRDSAWGVKNSSKAIGKGPAAGKGGTLGRRSLAHIGRKSRMTSDSSAPKEGWGEEKNRKGSGKKKMTMSRGIRPEGAKDMASAF